MLILKQLQTLANNSLTIWQRPEPLLTRIRLSWQYQQQCYRVLQQHISNCLTDLSQLPQKIVEQHEHEPMPPMVFALRGLPGQTLASAFLLQNDQDTSVEFALRVDNIAEAGDNDPVKNHDQVHEHIRVQIQPQHGILQEGGSEPIQISVLLHPNVLPGQYVAVLRIEGFVEQTCHLEIQVQAASQVQAARAVEPTGIEAQ